MPVILDPAPRQVNARKARAKKLTPEQRSEIARRAVMARWLKAKKKKH
jgi:hypothetical protein